jgi:hypothetical protein
MDAKQRLEFTFYVQGLCEQMEAMISSTKFMRSSEEAQDVILLSRNTLRAARDYLVAVAANASNIKECEAALKAALEGGDRKLLELKPPEGEA